MAKRRRKIHDDNDDRPWNEQRWEAFMKEGDLRAARFGELLETLHDDPDHEVKIAREMGWDDFADRLEGKESEDEEDRAWIAEMNEAAAEAAAEIEAEKEAGSEDGEDAFNKEEKEIEAIPAFQIAKELGMKIHDALTAVAKKYVPPDGQEEFDKADDEDIARLIGKARIGCHIAAAKISGGHAMGYEDDVLCGNIVNCRRGLEGVTEAIDALQELKSLGVVPAKLVDELLRDADAVKQAVEERIAELRKRVWWS